MLASCSYANKQFNLLFDLHKPQIFSLRGKLTAIKIPKTISNLSPIQRKVLDITNRKKQATISEIFVETGLGFNEVSGIVSSLARMNLLNVSGNKITSNTSILTNFSRISFNESVEYLDMPHAEKLATKVRESDIKNLLTSLGIEVLSKKTCWLPFFKVKTSDAEKTLDGLSYSLSL